MFKQIFDYFNSLMSSSWRLARAEEDIKAIKARAEKQDDSQHNFKEALIKVLSDVEKDRAVALEQRNTAQRDQQILIMQIKEMLKDHEQRALPPGTSSQDTITAILARLDAVEKRLDALENTKEQTP